MINNKPMRFLNYSGEQQHDYSKISKFLITKDLPLWDQQEVVNLKQSKVKVINKKNSPAYYCMVRRPISCILPAT